MGERFHILHVEDDDLDAMNVQRLLRESGVVSGLTHAVDGIEALEILRERRVPHHGLVTLLDICMPRMSGLEFLRELRADPALRHIPVVVLTTSDDVTDLGSAYDLHVAGYLVKPLSSDRLRRALGAFASYWAEQELI